MALDGREAAADEPPVAGPRRPSVWPSAAVVLGFAAMVIMSQHVVRLDYGPDEHDHLEYVFRLATRGELIDLHERTGTLIREHPPLYYGILALFWRAAGGDQSPKVVPPGPLAIRHMTPRSIAARRLDRFVSGLMAIGALALLARLLIVLEVAPAWRPPLLLVVAACPMLQYVAGTVNCENLSILWSTMICLGIVTRVRAGDCTVRQAGWLGLLVGGGMWAKRTTLFAAPLALWAVWSLGAKEQRAKRLLTFAAVAVAVGIWWPLRAKLSTGEWFPGFWPDEYTQKPPLELFLQRPANLLIWIGQIIVTSFLPEWCGSFIPSPLAVAISIGGAAGVALLFVVKLRDRRDRAAWQLRIMAAVGLMLLMLGILQFCYTVDWRGMNSGGRYLLNGIPWLATLLAASAPRDRAARPHVLVGIALGLLVLFDLGWWGLADGHFVGIEQRGELLERGIIPENSNPEDIFGPQGALRFLPPALPPGEEP